MRRSTSRRCPTVSGLGLRRSCGSVSQAGKCITSAPGRSASSAGPSDSARRPVGAITNSAPAAPGGATPLEQRRQQRGAEALDEREVGVDGRRGCGIPERVRLFEGAHDPGNCHRTSLRAPADTRSAAPAAGAPMTHRMSAVSDSGETTPPARLPPAPPPVPPLTAGSAVRSAAVPPYAAAADRRPRARAPARAVRRTAASGQPQYAAPPSPGPGAVRSAGYPTRRLPSRSTPLAVRTAAGRSQPGLRARRRSRTPAGGVLHRLRRATAPTRRSPPAAPPPAAPGSGSSLWCSR